ncbi:MAG: hypothetical protein RMJ00_03105 [Nitrososphaerota archaeon]|nr:hypothetical protein [Candidatus Bathyarchaeota archaeon]MDW8061666.1 hypothetical protein [Nitrososphaerota archaeon]
MRRLQIDYAYYAHTFDELVRAGITRYYGMNGIPLHRSYDSIDAGLSVGGIQEVQVKAYSLLTASRSLSTDRYVDIEKGYRIAPSFLEPPACVHS